MCRFEDGFNWRTLSLRSIRFLCVRFLPRFFSRPNFFPDPRLLFQPNFFFNLLHRLISSAPQSGHFFDWKSVASNFHFSSKIWDKAVRLLPQIFSDRKKIPKRTYIYSYNTNLKKIQRSFQKKYFLEFFRKVFNSEGENLKILGLFKYWDYKSDNDLVLRFRLCKVGG